MLGALPLIVLILVVSAEAFSVVNVIARRVDRRIFTNRKHVTKSNHNPDDNNYHYFPKDDFHDFESLYRETSKEDGQGCQILAHDFYRELNYRRELELSKVAKDPENGSSSSSKAFTVSSSSINDSTFNYFGWHSPTFPVFSPSLSFSFPKLPNLDRSSSSSSAGLFSGSGATVFSRSRISNEMQIIHPAASRKTISFSTSTNTNSDAVNMIVVLGTLILLSTTIYVVIELSGGSTVVLPWDNAFDIEPWIQSFEKDAMTYGRLVLGDGLEVEGTGYVGWIVGESVALVESVRESMAQSLETLMM